MLNPDYRESAESRSSSVHEGFEEPATVTDKFNGTEILDTPVNQWDVERVAIWVRNIPFPESDRYASMFIQAAVHGPLLLQLDKELLIDIGVKRKVHISRWQLKTPLIIFEIFLIIQMSVCTQIIIIFS